MAKAILIIIAILILITGFFLVVTLKNTITGASIQEPQRMYTKAICNETNFCQDNYIICQGNNLISKNPITGASIQHPKNWTDPRTNNPKELC
jgi:hypothetical protein